MTPNILVCIPAYGNMVSVPTLNTTHMLIQMFSAKGIRGGIAAFSYPDVSEARNIMLTGWYDGCPDATHLLFIDSVTADTPILVRRIGDQWIDFIEACELMPPSARFSGLNRTYAHVAYEVLTHKGWQQPNAIMQAKVKKPILRISDERGTVCVTEDHSLFSNGEPLAGRDVQEGTLLDHIGLDSVEVPVNLINPVTEDYAEVLGFFAAEGSAGSMSCGPDSVSNGYFWCLSNKNKELLQQYAGTLESVHARRFILIEDKFDVWRLSPSAPSTLASYYENMFYTATLKKRVPKFILNAPKHIVEAFLRGYEKGDGHLDKNGMQWATTNSMTLAAGLSFLYKRVGRDFGVNPRRDDKPSIIHLYERKHGLDMLKRPAGVRHIQRDDDFDGYVYDLNTDAGTFVGGVGLFLLHNSDMGFSPQVVMDMLVFNEPMVGAIYTKKTLPVQWAASGLSEKEVKRNGNFMTVAGLGMGCFLIRRDAIDIMLEKMPDIIDTRMTYHAAKDMLGGRILRAFDTFDNPNDNQAGKLSEDLAFCQRWRTCGGDVWASLEHEIEHIGQYSYKANYIQYVAEREANREPLTLVDAAKMMAAE